MDQTVNILGGRSEVQFAAIGQTSGSAYLPAFDPENVQHLLTVVEEPINGWKTYTHTFRAKNRDYVDSLLQPFLIANPLPMLAVRFGLTAGNDSAWRPWEDHVLIDHRLSFRPDPKSGPTVTVRTADRLWLLHAGKKCRAHKGSMGSVMATLWKEIDGGNSIIEPTILAGHTGTSGTWYQAYESNWSFLMRAVLPLARNGDGVSNYRVFVRDNTLHFHSVGYGASTPKKIQYSAGAPGFDGLSVEDRFVEMAGGAGATGLRRVVYDPVTGESNIIESDSSKLLKLAGARSTYTNWDYRTSHSGQNLASVEEAKNQQHFSVLSSEVYQTTLSADKCMEIRVGDVLDIGLAESLQESTLYSGLWLVNKAIHTMKEGTLSSRYVVERGEFNQMAQQSVVGPDEYWTSSSAAGIDFNGSSSSPASASSLVATTSDSGRSVPIQPAG